MKNPFKKQPNPKIVDESDMWDDLQHQVLSDYLQNMEADLRYTIAVLTEEVEDLREELEALKKPKIKVENIDASKIVYKPFE